MFLLNLLLALAWLALTGQFTALNFLGGFAFGYLVLWLISQTVGDAGYFKKVLQVAEFVLFFLWQLLKANLRISWDILTPRHRMTPGVVAIPLDVKSEVEIALLANMITLTPGTLSLDVSDDKKCLYVHSVYIDDLGRFRKEIKEGFERRIMELFQ